MVNIINKDSEPHRSEATYLMIHNDFMVEFGQRNNE